MNTSLHYRLRIEPREELAHLVSLTSGLLASGAWSPAAGDPSGNGHDPETPIRAVDAARQLLEQLIDDVETSVTLMPQRYDLALYNQLPTE
jgi:hypothetical protein